MDARAPFFREQGKGTGVVCLHSNASTSSQWRLLMDKLSDRFRVIAVDGYGAGKSPPWPSDRPVRLEDEVSLLGAALESAGERFHLVGHSYGGAVALKTALMFPQRVRSVVVYEPTLFHLVVQGDPLDSPAEGIWRAASDAADAVDLGHSTAGARRFIDFWMGCCAWDSMPPARQTVVAYAVRNVRGWRDALFQESVPRSALARLDVPVLCLAGERSPESSLSVARMLLETLPRVTVVPQPGLGHMGPITHPERVNPQIAEFLNGHQSG
jgi:pimeloyl-ACP methyl ester carboxylesterase